MLRSLAVLFAVAPFVAAPTARAADDTPKDIVNRAIKAHGGEKFLTEHLAARTRETGTMDLPGLGKVDFTSDSSYMLPDKFKNTLEFTVMGQPIKVVSIMNGKTVTGTTTVGDMVMDSSETIKDAFKDVPHILAVGQLVPLVKDKKYKLDHFGEEKVNDKPAIGVRVSAKGEKDVTLFFDKETWLMVRMDYRGIHPTDGSEVNESRVMSDYAKTGDGIAYPKKVLVKHDDKLFITAKTESVEYLEELGESEFKK